MCSTKLLGLFMITMMVSSSCMAGGLRRAMVAGIYEQQRDHVVKKGNCVERRKNAVEDSLDKNIDNHHNIPRQSWGNNSPDNGEGSG
ncbi:TRF-like 8, putative isoform 1 [Hibiscus syriacus]|uniref:TRF-like 8, putative isoform 1 n=1 Tax=Hibiscus syriacus TaxID=106335 RepID=A0A6A3BYY4_HIBSY|nr:TRF-like 8, putative isoform 1 [Hibiscus syriacus]